MNLYNTAVPVYRDVIALRTYYSIRYFLQRLLISQPDLLSFLRCRQTRTLALSGSSTQILTTSLPTPSVNQLTFTSHVWIAGRLPQVTVTEVNGIRGSRLRVSLLVLLLAGRPVWPQSACRTMSGAQASELHFVVVAKRGD